MVPSDIGYDSIDSIAHAPARFWAWLLEQRHNQKRSAQSILQDFNEYKWLRIGLKTMPPCEELRLLSVWLSANLTTAPPINTIHSNTHNALDNLERYPTDNFRHFHPYQAGTHLH